MYVDVETSPTLNPTSASVATSLVAFAKPRRTALRRVACSLDLDAACLLNFEFWWIL